MNTEIFLQICPSLNFLACLCHPLFLYQFKLTLCSCFTDVDSNLNMKLLQKLITKSSVVNCCCKLYVCGTVVICQH